MTRSFSDYDEFASDVINKAIAFLINKKVLNTEQADKITPDRLWALAIRNGWRPPAPPK